MKTILLGHYFNISIFRFTVSPLFNFSLHKNYKKISSLRFAELLEIQQLQAEFAQITKIKNRFQLNLE